MNRFLRTLQCVQTVAIGAATGFRRVPAEVVTLDELLDLEIEWNKPPKVIRVCTRPSRARRCHLRTA